MIKVDSEIIREQYFASRVKAEIFIVETLKGLRAPARNEEHLKNAFRRSQTRAGSAKPTENMQILCAAAPDNVAAAGGASSVG